MFRFACGSGRTKEGKPEGVLFARRSCFFYFGHSMRRRSAGTGARRLAWKGCVWCVARRTAQKAQMQWGGRQQARGGQAGLSISLVELIPTRRQTKPKSIFQFNTLNTMRRAVAALAPRNTSLFHGKRNVVCGTSKQDTARIYFQGAAAALFPPRSRPEMLCLKTSEILAPTSSLATFTQCW